MSMYIKDTAGVLDYKFDWKALSNDSGLSDWLGSSETISAHAVSADSGITVDSSALSDANTSVTVWLSGGTLGKTYNIVCRITTNDGRTDERTMQVKVLNR